MYYYLAAEQICITLVNEHSVKSIIYMNGIRVIVEFNTSSPLHRSREAVLHQSCNCLHQNRTEIFILT